MPIYKFRDCLLNTTERSVMKGDHFVAFNTKTYDVLQYLVERSGVIVTKDELLGSVWNGSFVEESNLPVHVSKIRSSLKIGPDDRLIETVQGTGYRFIATVQDSTDAEWEAAYELSYPSRRRKSLDWDQPLASIAVLPFQNETGQTDLEYLCDGLTENLINELTRIRDLTVLARNTVFRYKGRSPDVVEIGSTLGVANVLTGRIRRIGNETVIAAELTSTSSGTQLWGSHYQDSNGALMTLQNRVVTEVVERLVQPKLSETFPRSSLTEVPESCRLHFKGRYLLEKHTEEDIYRAIEFFRRAIALDRNNIHSLVEIFEGYRSLYLYDYISYAEFLEHVRPITDEVDRRGRPDSDIVQMMYCDLAFLDWQFDRAATHCRNALGLNPNNLKGRLRYSDLLLQRRQFGEALEQLEALMIVDPLSAAIYTRIGRLFFWKGDFGNALAFLNDALDLEPNNHEALTIRGMVSAEVGELEAAVVDYQQSLRLGNQISVHALIAAAYAKNGLRAEALDLSESFSKEASGKPGYLVTTAHLSVALGNYDKAIEYLEEAIDHHEPDLRALAYDRRWIPLRVDPRFKELGSRIGLPHPDDYR